MNTNLTFSPSPLESLTLKLRWLESQARCDLYNWTSKREQLKHFTEAMQIRTRDLIKQVHKVWSVSGVTWNEAVAIYGEFPEVETTYTTTLTPALLYLHARLKLEAEHYNRIFDVQNSIVFNNLEREERQEKRMLPSWEKPRRKINCRKAVGSSEISEVFQDVFRISNSVLRMLSAFILITFIGSFVSYITLNLDSMLRSIASIMAHSGLEFSEAYGVVGFILYLMISMVVIISLELFHKPDNQELYDILLNMDERYSDSLANVLNAVDTIHNKDDYCPYAFETGVKLSEEEKANVR